jgi:hypothetical protein
MLKVKRKQGAGALWNFAWASGLIDFQLYVYEEAFEESTADFLLNTATKP